MSPDQTKKLLLVNLHFAPFSFVGGTIVAECLSVLRGKNAHSSGLHAALCVDPFRVD